MNPVLNTEAARQILGLKRGTLEKWRLRGCGPRFIKVGRAVRYRPEDIDAWLSSRTRRSTSDLGPEGGAG